MIRMLAVLANASSAACAVVLVASQLRAPGQLGGPETLQSCVVLGSNN